MSGHSKWHNIQGRKGKQDAIRSNQFTKLAKAITIAVQNGADPAANFSLRLAIDKAKEGGMPKDNIDRAIKRGTGELKDGLPMEELLYEAFGPGGVAILISAVTDNKNRTLPELKKILTTHGGSIAGAGSVQWMFEQWGVIVVNKEILSDRENFEMQLIESGAEDIQDEAGEVVVKTKVENFQKVLSVVKNLAIIPQEAEIRWLPKEIVVVEPDKQESLENLFGELEAHDDVKEFYTNAG
jgi:YebC/PmpR family DNA-binding regulatory protein